MRTNTISTINPFVQFGLAGALTCVLFMWMLAGVGQSMISFQGWMGSPSTTSVARSAASVGHITASNDCVQQKAVRDVQPLSDFQVLPWKHFRADA